jgi:hypothetical protein
MSSGPGRKNEQLRTKEIATAQKYMAKNQELDHYHAKREERRAARRFYMDGVIPNGGPMEGFQAPGGVCSGGQQGSGGGRNVDAGGAEPGHKMFPTVRGPEKKGIFPTQADGKPAKPTPYNYAEPPGRRGGGGFGGMGGMGRGGRG